jgi:quinol monooxygenase YgiN
MPSIALIVRGRARPGQRDAVLALYERLQAPRALTDAAQLVVVWCADVADADAFWLFEVYASAEALQANAQAPWFWECMAQAQPLLAGQPEVVTGSPGWTKGIPPAPPEPSPG